MSNQSALNDSLNKLSELSSSGVARINRSKRPSRRKSESAKSLLGNLLDDSIATAQAEREREEERKRREEEEAQRQKEYAEEMAKLEAEQAILAEQKEIEARRIRQAEMQAQLQREKDIEAGLIDLEEEARQKRAEEERQAAIAAEKARKEAEKLAAQKLRISQQNELEALRLEEVQAAAKPKSSNAVVYVLIVLILAAAGGASWYFYSKNQEINYYAMQEEYTPNALIVSDARMDKFDVAVSVVTQEAPPKPVKKTTSKNRKPSTATAAPKPAPSLTGGKKGGIFGSGKL